MKTAIADNSLAQTTTVAIISDTHTVLDPRIAEAIRRADIAIHAGDIGNASVLSAMHPKTGRVIAVAGNNDHPIFWPVEQTEVLESMPEIAQFELPGVAVAEVKQDGFSINSDFIQQMRAMKTPPERFSKYCQGITHFYPQVKYNRFKPRTLLINRIIRQGENYGYHH